MIKLTRILIILLIIGVLFGGNLVFQYINNNKTFNKIISLLQADSRIAEVLVTDVSYDEKTNKTFTTIKFLEYDIKNKPLEPRYFTFAGNIIQFQSLVVRFDDSYVKRGDLLRGKSVYLFWKVFMLDGKDTKEYEITKIKEIPAGYKIEGSKSRREEKFWENFWKYALNTGEAKKRGIKNAQIEAPGTMFIPGTLYTLKIEHDGGIRIDSTPLAEILKGEKIPK
ncbi:MAG: hypothetical protein KBB01_00290 [Candidatus Omnitrophica bacterium]|jgi:hypothetical protein|nr:hypothetical protein [Candidatus Omnitrophota bacterium]